MKKILILIDGAADLPCSELHGKTPFEAAHTPNLDYFAKNGKMGYMYPINERKKPESDEAVFAVLGCDKKKYPGRGLVEVYGSELKIKNGDLAIRANFATIKNGHIIDRRVGRTLKTSEAKRLARAINWKVNIGYKFKFKSTLQHRGVLIVKGGFSENITNTDPEYTKTKGNRLPDCLPLDDDEVTKVSANIINSFVDQSTKILGNHSVNKKRRKNNELEANVIITRGAGTFVPELTQIKDWAAIVGMPTEKGIAILSGMKIFDFKYPRFTGKDIYQNLYKGLKTEIRNARKYLFRKIKKYNGIYIHLKNTDIPGHDGRPLDKKKMIEIIDKDFISKLKKLKNVKICITCDHATPCSKKIHSADPVPVLIYGVGKDSTTHFCEKEAKKGKLGKIYGKDLMNILVK